MVLSTRELRRQRRFRDASQATRCEQTVKLDDGSTAQCGRNEMHPGVGKCWQHSTRGKALELQWVRTNKGKIVAKPVYFGPWPFTVGDYDFHMVLVASGKRLSEGFWLVDTRSGYRCGCILLEKMERGPSTALARAASKFAKQCDAFGDKLLQMLMRSAETVKPQETNE